MKRRIRVAHVIDHLGLGGAQTFLRDLVIQQLETGETGFANIDRIIQVKGDDGFRLMGDTLKVLMNKGLIAYSTQILLKKDSKVVSIPMDNVVSIERKNIKYGWILALLGFSADFLVILSIIIFIRNMDISLG